MPLSPTTKRIACFSIRKTKSWVRAQTAHMWKRDWVLWLQWVHNDRRKICWFVGPSSTQNFRVIESIWTWAPRILQIMKWARNLCRWICKDAEIKPSLMPLCGEVLTPGTSTEDDAKLDVWAQNFWSPLAKPFADIRVSHPKLHLMQPTAFLSCTNVNFYMLLTKIQ